jgi:hypothetical protein
MHAPSLSPMEYVEPATHAEHWRSAVAVPPMAWPSPAGQVRHATHELSPDVAVNVPSVHGKQVRSDTNVALELSYVPATHSGVSAVHTRLLDLVGADSSH